MPPAGYLKLCLYALVSVKKEIDEKGLSAWETSKSHGTTRLGMHAEVMLSLPQNTLAGSTTPKPFRKWPWNFPFRDPTVNLPPLD